MLQKSQNSDFYIQNAEKKKQNYEFKVKIILLESKLLVDEKKSQISEIPEFKVRILWEKRKKFKVLRKILIFEKNIKNSKKKVKILTSQNLGKLY